MALPEGTDPDSLGYPKHELRVRLDTRERGRSQPVRFSGA